MDKNLLEELNKITKELGQNLLKWKELNLTQGHWEGTQFKAQADVMAHEFLEQKLKELTPEIPVISEENPNSLVDERPDTYWIIDPIDGTASFANGFKGFVTQVALIKNSNIELASVYAPALDELYYAKRAEGSFLNGNRLSMLSNKKLESVIDNYPTPKGVTKELMDDLGFEKYVECGSIGLKMCKVAAGCADLFFKDVPIRDWDLAPAHLILNEVQGVLSDASGNEFKYEGSYEHQGLIATLSKEIQIKIVNWNKKN